LNVFETKQDNEIRSSVYKISGSTPTSNYISLPKLSGQSLNLNGRYIYFLFKPTANKCFTIHVDMDTEEKVNVRASFSNLHKEIRANSTSLQFPYVIKAPAGSIYERIEQSGTGGKEARGAAPPLTKWSVCCVDMLRLCETYAGRTYKCVRGVRVCANMLIKNIITSDVLYEPGLTGAEARARHSSAFPRELAYPCDKFNAWHDLYELVLFPSESASSSSAIISRLAPAILVKENYSNTQPDNSSPKLANGLFVESHTAIDSIAKRSLLNNMTMASMASSVHAKPMALSLPLVGVPLDDEAEREKQPERSMQQRQERDIHVYPLKSAHVRSKSPAIVIDQQTSNLKDPTLTKGDAILSIRRVIGFGCGGSSSSGDGSGRNLNNPALNYNNCVKWASDGRLVYAAQSILVVHELSAGKQTCMVGHSDKIAAVAVSPDGSTIASGQSGPFACVRLWDINTTKCVAMFRQHEHSLSILEWSSCGAYLCGVGKDKQGKTMLVVWNVCAGNENHVSTHRTMRTSTRLVAKAHTDASITRAMFVHYDSTRLITCGRNNIRVWRLKDEQLRACSVNLAPYLRTITMSSSSNSNVGKTERENALEFSDMCPGVKYNDSLVYACTRNGQIFEINVGKVEIARVRSIEPLMRVGGGEANNSSGAICLNSLTVSDAYCATGSADGYLRLWPLDFTQVCVEAEHDSGIGLVRFSSDYNLICTATLKGSLGVMNMYRKEYSTHLRAHTDAVVDVDVDAAAKYMATSSIDGTVRVWNYPSAQQLYDFGMPNERPTRLCFCSTSSILFACGFDSGVIRVFDVSKARLVAEMANAKCEITDLLYSPHMRLIAGSIDKCLYLYDTLGDAYALIRMLPNTLTVPGSLTLSVDGRHAALVGPTTQALISIYELATLSELKRIETNECCSRLAYTSDGQLFCATDDAKLLRFDVRSGRQIADFDWSNVRGSSASTSLGVECICVSNDGRFIAVAEKSHLIRLCSCDMRVMQTFVAHSNKINKILWTTDDATLISAGDCLICWDFRAGKCTHDAEDARALNEKSLNISNLNSQKSFQTKSSKNEKRNESYKENDENEQKSLERPRTPPIACESAALTITCMTSDDDDTFLNDEINMTKNDILG
jgi:WD repeat-containing protein 90